MSAYDVPSAFRIEAVAPVAVVEVRRAPRSPALTAPEMTVAVPPPPVWMVQPPAVNPPELKSSAKIGGFVAWIDQACVAGLGSVLPAASVAVTENVWPPKPRPV